MIRLAVDCPAAEMPAWSLAASLLGQCIGQPCTASFGPDAAGDVIALSLLAGLTEAPWADVRAGWHARCAAMLGSGKPVILTTVFRHVSAMGTIRRIRQLNLMAAELSQELGTYVIDLDAALAHAGGLALGSDAQLQSAAAVQLAAETIGAALLSSGLDDVLAPDALAAAQTAWPGLRQAGPVFAAKVVLTQARTGAGVTQFVPRADELPQPGLKELLRDLAHRRVSLGQGVPVVATRLRARLRR